MALITNRATGGGFRFEVRSRQGQRVVASVEQMRVMLDNATQGVYFNAINRWRTQRFNARLPHLLRQALFIRSGGGRHEDSLTGSTLEWAGQGPEDSSGRERTYLYHMRMVMPKHAAEYGYTQEVGRKGGSPAKGKYYMVPLLSAYGRKKHVDVRKELEDPNVWLLPRGDNNFGVDKAGRAVKYVYRFNRVKKTKKAQAERSVARAQQKVAKNTDKESLRGRGTLLMLAYPYGTTGIPGASRGRFAKKVPKLASPLVRNFGFSSTGGIQASRWFTYSLIKTVPSLDTFLKEQTGKIAGAARMAMKAGLGGGV